MGFLYCKLGCDLWSSSLDFYCGFPAKILTESFKTYNCCQFIKGLDIIFLLARLWFVFVTDLFLKQRSIYTNQNKEILMKSFDIAVFSWLNSFWLYIDPKKVSMQQLSFWARSIWNWMVYKLNLKSCKQHFTLETKNWVTT